MNMNTELLDDTLDEMFEEIDSEDYNVNESEMEELETAVSEDIERWVDDGDIFFKSILLRITRGRVILRYFVTQESSTDERKAVLTKIILRSDLHIWCSIILFVRNTSRWRNALEEGFETGGFQIQKTETFAALAKLNMASRIKGSPGHVKCNFGKEAAGSGAVLDI
ncbi:hypothetical protein AVEN_39798-1 [Araneus ventricosus]|uniref:Uncharacterized protein n=1 Tax=Araneus ventricosus TaxID=182803 RepID=A0A4Y2S875_ARAVE|nr:hypothetical protein AVEN_39798-1 [Araneus ventricosus]